MKSLVSCSLALALGLSALPAGATTLTIGGTNAGNEGVMSSVAGAYVETFDNGLPSFFTVNGTGGVVSGSSANVYKAPTGDTSKYLTTGTGSVTAFSPIGGVNYLGFYWGSVDTFNSLVLTTTTGSTETFTGSSLTPLGFNVNGDNSAYVNFFANPGVFWNKAQFSSTKNAFEIDNVSAAAPEPASLAMIATGLIALGAGALRRRKQSAEQV